ncbi:MAG TPA: M20/M25/M40 family metallo-hydrolase [Bryobacteraceae bacterium]|nr:M20/M25/M40 family metallo-hydrolase [Bryobacteraceae bacterium]
MRVFFCLALTFLAGVRGFAADAPNLTDQYREAANRLIAAALTDHEGYDRLAYLCYRIGNRLSGSPGLERAIAWSVGQMKAAGLSNVRTIPVKVPHWVRGAESAQLVEPENRPLHMLGLGMSVPTPPGGVTAAVITVNSFDELSKLGADKVRGKMVLFNEPYQGYAISSAYRFNGPSQAAALGAVAVLVRSVTPLAMQVPHTGTLRYAAGAPEIPAAAISPEDAMMIARFCAEGTPVSVRLEMADQMLPDADSANVIGEIPGSEHPEQIVVMGGHIDSWDVGEGAQDDGAAIMASLEAVALMKKLSLQPRRTLRVAFWVNEENGSRGGEAYRAWAGDQVKNHVAAIEMDGGAETPVGFGAAQVNASGLALLRQIGKLLDPIGAGAIDTNGGGEDIRPLMNYGVPGIAEHASGANYFNWHHTEADTLDKVDPEDFRKSVAALAVMSYVIADMPGKLEY